MPLVSVDAKALPIIHSVDYFSLISDSGMTRCRITAKIFDIYSNEGDPYWHFPERIFVEQFDSLFQVNASIEADTAYYHEKSELWHAIGNVVAVNMEGTTFETSELFWDMKVPAGEVNAFYTFKMVKITKIDGTFIYGLDGFRADKSLSTLFLFSGKGELYIDESSPPDSIKQDTIPTEIMPLP